MNEEPASAIVQVRSFCATNFKMSDAASDQLLQEIAGKTKEVVSLFEVNIGAAADYEGILKKANEALVELTLQSQMHATQLQEQNQVLKQQATTNALTGLNNRAAFDQALAEQCKIAQLEKKPLTLLLLDVDKFKSVNDRFGHQAGDRILQATARILRGNTRETDLIARYGGEEFVVVLPATDADTAHGICERIVAAFQSTGHPIGSEHARVTISIGCATHGAQLSFANVTEFVKAADQALYTAKLRGRNQSVPFDRQLPSVLDARAARTRA